MKTLFLNSGRPLPTGNIYQQIKYVSGNIGNSYISYAVGKLLGLEDCNTVWNQSIWQAEDTAAGFRERASDARRIVLTLQDQIRSDLPDEPFRTAYAFLRQLEPLDAPLLVFSLGANVLPGDPADVAKHLSQDKIRFFSYLADRALTIGVRGEFTANVLADLGITNVEVVGCPSYFEAGAGRIVPEAQGGSRKQLALTGSARLLLPHEPIYFLQGDYDWPIIDLGYMPEAEWYTRDGSLRALLDQTALPVLEAVADGRAFFMSDFEEWKAFIASSCSAVFGSRLHAAILALNAGVPAAVSNDDARAREVCTYFGIPLVAPGLVRHASPARIARLCSVEQVNERYDFCYLKFCRWLARHGQQVVDPPSPGYPMPKIDRVPRNVARDRVEDAVRIEVSRLYETYCMRKPTPRESDYWAASVQSSQSFDTMIQMISISPSGRERFLNAITNCYLDYFGRPPRTEETQTWQRVLADGATLHDMTITLLDSPEGVLTSDTTIKALYLDCLGREPAPEEIEVWRRTLRQGGTYGDLRRRLLAVEPAGFARACELLSAPYRRFMGRSVETHEVELWLEVLRHNGMIEEINATLFDRHPISGFPHALHR